VLRALKLELDPELSSRLVTAQRLEELRGHRGSGLSELDAILGGGWPRGALSEISGRRSSGRTSVVLAALARAGRAGEATALVDTGGALDPRAAAACGVALPRLLWIRCTPAQALKAADLVVSAGGFDVIAIDLGEERSRAPTASWVRLKHGAERQGTSVLVATTAHAVGAFAAAAVELGAATPRFLTDVGPPLFDGARVKVECRRRAARNTERSETDGPQVTHEMDNTKEEQASCAWLAFTCPR
jgi:recA bacterial DNA recombination protein